MTAARQRRVLDAATLAVIVPGDEIDRKDQVGVEHGGDAKSGHKTREGLGQPAATPTAPPPERGPIAEPSQPREASEAQHHESRTPEDDDSFEPDPDGLVQILDRQLVHSWLLGGSRDTPRGPIGDEDQEMTGAGKGARGRRGRRKVNARETVSDRAEHDRELE